MKKISVSLFVALPMLLAASGCEISTCEGDECDFDSIFDEDAGGSGGGDDGGNNGELDGGDNGAGGDDGGGATGGDNGGGSGGEPLTLEEFCTAQLRVGQAWADAFDTCSCPNDTATARNNFLAFSLTFGGTSRCLDGLQPLVSGGKVSFVASKAASCAEAFASQFEGPPAECPKLGFDLGALRAQIGHGAASIEQLSECRQAFAGSVAMGQPCEQHLECAGTGRCRGAPGGGKTCQAALREGLCEGASDCDFGFTCVGTMSTGGLVCRPNDDLGKKTENCSGDRQCKTELLCAANKCSAPVAELICE